MQTEPRPSDLHLYHLLQYHICLALALGATSHHQAIENALSLLRTLRDDDTDLPVACSSDAEVDENEKNHVDAAKCEETYKHSEDTFDLLLQGQSDSESLGNEGNNRQKFHTCNNDKSKTIVGSWQREFYNQLKNNEERQLIMRAEARARTEFNTFMAVSA